MSNESLSRAKRGTPLTSGMVRRLLGRRASEVDIEMQMHFDMLVEDLIAQGKTPDEARRAASTRMGDLRAVRNATVAINTRLQRREGAAAMAAAFIQDARIAARMLSRNKLWTGLAVVTLALAIGANSALFSIVNAVLLRPLPFVAPGRIVSVSTPIGGEDQGTTSDVAFDAWKARSKSFSALAMYRRTTMTRATSARARKSHHRGARRIATAMTRTSGRS